MKKKKYGYVIENGNGYCHCSGHNGFVNPLSGPEYYDIYSTKESAEATLCDYDMSEFCTVSKVES